MVSTITGRIQQNTKIDDNVAFHKELYKIAKSEGFNDFKIMYYTTSSRLTSYNSSYMWGQDKDNRICEVMLNYDTATLVGVWESL